MVRMLHVVRKITGVLYLQKENIVRIDVSFVFVCCVKRCLGDFMIVSYCI